MVDGIWDSIFPPVKPEDDLKTNKKIADKNPNEVRTVKEIIEAAGFEFEEFEVETEDGYLLTMHRVFKNSSAGKPAIMLQHGILSSSETWILNGSESMAFRLATEGYDVWMGNNRGSLYSRKHKTLNPDMLGMEGKFFDYSFFELGKYDVPA